MQEKNFMQEFTRELYSNQDTRGIQAVLSPSVTPNRIQTIPR